VEINALLCQIYDGVCSCWITIPWLTDASRVDDDTLIELFGALNVRVPQNEDLFTVEHGRLKL
jgi:hypothetical protein